MRALKYAAACLVLLLIFDALANGGSWRRQAIHAFAELIAAITRSNWHGLG